MKRNVKIALTGVIAALALALGYLEFLLPINIAGIPGIKLGSANVLVMAALYLLGPAEAAFVSFAKIMLSWLVFGSFTSFVYSAFGGALSLAVMILLKRSEAFSEAGVSVSGAVAHNVGQLAAASLMLGTGAVWYYLPALLISAAVMGAVNGYLLKAALPAISKIIKRSLR